MSSQSPINLTADIVPDSEFKILNVTSLPVAKADPLDVKSKELARQVREFAKNEMAKAIENLDFPRYLQAESFSRHTSNNFKWILTLGPEYENYSFEDFLKNDFNDPSTISEAQKKAKACEMLVLRISELSHSDGIMTTLHRIRNGDESTYIAVAHFDEQYKEAGYWMYTPRGVACAEHHCDVLYKLHRDTTKSFLLTYKTLPELRAESHLNADLKSTVEFVEVSKEIGEKVAAEREMTRALMNYYGNLSPSKIPDTFI